MENLRGLIKSLIEIYGKQIITEKTFVNMLADYRGFDQNPAARKILKAITARKYAALIINLTTSEYDLMRLRMFAHELADSDGFQTDLVETLMRMLVFVCNEQEKKRHDYQIEKRDNKYGCVDSTGQILIPFEYDKMRDFESEYGIHIVCVKNFNTGHIYTETGELVFYGEDTFNLTNEKTLWIVKKDNKYGAIHPNGEVVVPLIYKHLLTVNPQQKNSNLLIVEAETGKGVIDYHGKQILPPLFENICNQIDAKFDIIEAKLAKRYMFFHSDGSIASIPEDFYQCSFQNYNEDSHKMPQGYRTASGKCVISTTQNDIADRNGEILLERLGKFAEGLAPAFALPWVGFVDFNLEFKIKEFRNHPDSRFDFVFAFDHGLAKVCKGNKSGLIDANGKFIEHPQYEEIERRNWCVILRNDKLEYRFNNDVYSGYTDAYGNIYPYHEYSKIRNPYCGIFENIYDVTNLYEGKALAVFKNFIGIITPEAKSILPIEYEWIRSRYDFSCFQDRHKIDCVRRNGIWGEIHVSQGFIQFDSENNLKLEEYYIKRHIDNNISIPYFLEDEKSDLCCGFRFRNYFLIPSEKYEFFMANSSNWSFSELKEWLIQQMILNNHK